MAIKGNVIGLISAAILTTTGCSGVNSQTLSRPVALAILQKTPNALKQQPAVIFELSTRIAISNASEDSQSSEAMKAWINDLVSVGLIKIKQTSILPAAGAIPERTLYQLTPLSQANVNVGYPNSDSEYIDVILEKPTIKEILGIRQEGTDADVEVSVSKVPTPLNDKVRIAVQKELALCPPSSGGMFGPPTLYFCAQWPKQVSSNASSTATFHFVRYDDGWRLATQ